jgi:hypothetical protein
MDKHPGKIPAALLAFLVACGGPDAQAPQGDSGVAADATRPWRGTLPHLRSEVTAPRGWTAARSIVHLHSPWSHDACDGRGYEDGVLDTACLADLRAALCDTAVDFAFITDHPDHAATVPWEDALLAQPGDTLLEGPHGTEGVSIPCPAGHSVTWLPGIEDELMPVGLQRHAGGGDITEAHGIYNREDAEAIAADVDAGALVFVNHTEGRSLEELAAVQAAGGAGIEVFNLHAAFDPRIRGADLGLDPAGWLSEIVPFTGDEGTAEPDLYFLGVLTPQAPSLAAWDALSATGPAVGVSGTDAHQNVMPLLLRDGERGDSYRRMLRWFNTTLLVDADTPAAARDALADGRAYVAFEALGTPTGVDLHHRSDAGAIVEMGGAVEAAGTLTVGCPALTVDSPQGSDAPEIVVKVLRDGEVWAEGCGEHPVSGPGVYRVEVWMTPRHLRPFLGDSPDVWMKPYPWVYTNPIRVTGAR